MAQVPYFLQVLSPFDLGGQRYGWGILITDAAQIANIQSSAFASRCASVANPAYSGTSVSSSVSPAFLSAAGTTQATAAALAGQVNVVTAVASGAGVILAANLGNPVRIINRGVNPLLVYPQAGAQIESAGTNAAVTVTVGGSAEFLFSSLTQWYAA